MSTVLLIRHGQSLSNIGLPFLRPETVELTENGWLQAEAISQYLNKETDLDYIVTSSFKRTKQTAEPTLSLFPSVLREVWPVHEFTYLGQQHDILSSIYERRPIVQDYWRQCKPSERDSADSESFVLFIKRIKQVHFQLRETNFKTIAIFSHEQFMCAFLWCLQRRWRNLTQDDMRDYREFLDANHIPNGGIVRMQLDENYRIKESQMITSHLDTSLIGSCLEHSVTNDEIEMQFQGINMDEMAQQAI